MFMRIHGGVYVFLGILMSLYARFIQSKVQKSSLSLFFWIGLGFVAFGVFRLITSYIFEDKSKSSIGKKNMSGLDAIKRERENYLNKHDSNEPEKNQVESRDIIACHRCSTKHYSNSNFCHMCGSSLK